MKRTGILFDHLYSFDLFKLLNIKQKKKKKWLYKYALQYLQAALFISSIWHLSVLFFYISAVRQTVKTEPNSCSVWQ